MNKMDMIKFCWCSKILFWVWVTKCGGGSAFLVISFVCSKALHKFSFVSLSDPIYHLHFFNWLGYFLLFCLLSQSLMCMRWTLTQNPRIPLCWVLTPSGSRTDRSRQTTRRQCIGPLGGKFNRQDKRINSRVRTLSSKNTSSFKCQAVIKPPLRRIFPWCIRRSCISVSSPRKELPCELENSATT